MDPQMPSLSWDYDKKMGPISTGKNHFGEGILTLQPESNRSQSSLWKYHLLIRMIGGGAKIPTHLVA